ncbi:hypothetical protein OQA88_10913 [Cercophora sp. LCS_1]
MDREALTQRLVEITELENPDEAISAAVQKLSDEATSTTSTIGDFVWDAYDAIFHAVEQVSADKQSTLVEFVTQLSKVELRDARGQPLMYEGGKVWTDMPAFGWYARDLWNFDPLSESFTINKRLELESSSTFLALLTAKSDIKNPKDPFNFSLFGLWSLRTAFEENPGRDVDITAAVRLAAPWVSAAGHVLWKLSQDGSDIAGGSGIPGPKYAEREWKGFTTDRWQVWKDGFVAAQDWMAHPEAKEIAKAAAGVMEKASTS